MLRGRTGLSVMACAWATVLALVAPAAAGIPDDDGAFHGCHDATSGALRLVEQGVACGPSEAAVTWTSGPASAASPVRLQAFGQGGPIEAGDWIDVPGATAAVDPGEGQCVATLTGSLLHRGGDSRASVRILLRRVGVPDLPVGGRLDVWHSGEALADGRLISVPFMVQGLLHGTGSVVPQVRSELGSWVLGDPAVLLVEC